MSAITGKTRLLAVIGSPVSHSLSPLIQNRFAEVLNLPFAYMAFDVTNDTLEGFTEAARLLNIAGFNVTMPLKESVLPYLDGIDDSAARLGAVNTVVNRSGRLFGYNTDAGGFIMALERCGISPAKTRALILGAGGAARSVASALIGAGANVRVAARSPRKAEAITGAECFDWSAPERAADGCSLLVNATPLGMRGAAADFEDFSFLRSLAPNALVFDLIYAPPVTALMRAASAIGLPTANGLTHLVCQAALSFEIFTGFSSPPSILDGLIAGFPPPPDI